MHLPALHCSCPEGYPAIRATANNPLICTVFWVRAHYPLKSTNCIIQNKGFWWCGTLTVQPHAATKPLAWSLAVSCWVSAFFKVNYTCYSAWTTLLQTILSWELPPPKFGCVWLSMVDTKTERRLWKPMPCLHCCLCTYSHRSNAAHMRLERIKMSVFMFMFVAIKI